jgi:hypothetical protein
MKIKILCYMILGLLSITLSAQNMGAKLPAGTLPNTTLDVNGAASLREGTALTLANGANNDINLATEYSFYRITGPTAAFSITGFNNGQDGRILTVVNATTQTMTISGSTGSVAANQLLTGGLTFTVSANGSATFQYNTTLSRWVLTGTSGSSTGGVGTTVAIVKTVDESVASSTTQQNDDVFLFTVAPNSTYILDATLMVLGNSISMSYVSPSGTYKIYGYAALSGSYNFNLNNGSTSSYSLSGGTLNSINLSGTIITGATGGTFQFRWTQLSSSATATVVQAYSFMRLYKAL